ncbi:GNAT family N-acetyltransferase [Candidatus Bathyarchaeota archaeon]|jgi:N-acetylglutamate synthase-like GNAT family acetyltransferase|nr:GNAT family N-acetyltransferase [Candidatus Bathyarchaeota archaeon]MBT4319367.1 GNAT family N-acetyltransferase [Candidatus Bathyarchaeota archaeon]MBT4424162.1 GNAT family N-acetyltransferase [Candidatus Bathyarchaeota archaeon]MBT6603654.1 GNAT family N-acetyltransferase [Candidatus Bathyarchaeota archaeon]MBT7187547.1 GNAT family N-acetyltransferase [Candidatus Bathyarchaeota archaeon]
MSITIRTGLEPGDLGYITYMHGRIYHDEYGFDSTFEPYVARPMSEFSLAGDQSRQQIWVVEMDGKIVGCIAIVDAGGNEAQLRWLLLTKETRGKGLGERLMSEAVDFCREKGYNNVFLWTIDALHAARGLYLKHRFKVTEEKKHVMWGVEVNEQRYDLKLKG